MIFIGHMDLYDHAEAAVYGGYVESDDSCDNEDCQATNICTC